MADNFSYTPGTGGTGAADDIGGVHFPRVKIIHGADGTNDGDVSSANPLPVTHEVFGTLNDSAITDPAATEGSMMEFLRGILTAQQDATITSGSAGSASAEVLTVQGIASMTPLDVGRAHIVRVAPPVNVATGGYEADECMGGEQTIAAAARTSGGSGWIVGVTAAIEDDSSSATDAWLADDIEVFFFDSDPSGTYTDTTAFSMADADCTKIIDSVVLDTKVECGNVSMLKARNINVPYVCSGGTSLFAVAVNRGGQDPEATGGVTFTYHLMRD